MAKLAAIVHVTDENGVSHAFTPADEVPAWAASKITNPKAWAEAPEVSASRLTEPAPPVKKAPAKRAAPRRKAAQDGTVRGD
ncbi:hypothetical protein ACIQMR_35145 [Streptomyces sp. NPDC091376]|uniref:hypothetical protein n=1 Tax=Streptomyces sp. NPDC091376 TaxID=3365994 RepID=UPI0037FDB8B2